MNKIVMVFIIFLIIVGTVTAQTYEATIQQSINGSTLNVDLYLRCTGGTSANLGNVTLTINFDTGALTYVGKDAAYDGRWDDGSSASYQNITSSNVSNRASLDVLKTVSGSGLDVPSTATRFGRIQFTIDVPSQNSGITWNTTFSAIYDWSGTLISSFTFTNPGDFSLPVQMARFSAETSKELGVLIHWRTESEVNTIGFDILRSEADQSSFIKINPALIPGQGNSSSGTDYSFSDRNIREGVIYWYKVIEIAQNGTQQEYGPIKVEGVNTIPDDFRLSHSYPNPFNPETNFKYQLAEDSKVTINVYNLLGERIKQLVNESKPAGYYTETWEGVNENNQRVSSGIYLIYMQAGSFSMTRKITLIR